MKYLFVPAKLPTTLTSKNDYSGLRGFQENIFLLKKFTVVKLVLHVKQCKCNDISLCLFLQSIWIWLLQSVNASFRRAAKVKKTFDVCLSNNKNARSTDYQVFLIGLSRNALFTSRDSP